MLHTNALLKKNLELQFLSLLHNQISFIPSVTFKDLTKLQYVSLDNNELQTIDANIFNNNEKLKVIYLHNNKIKSLSTTMFIVIILMQKVQLKYIAIMMHTFGVMISSDLPSELRQYNFLAKFFIIQNDGKLAYKLYLQ